MCGIIGYIGHRLASHLLVDSLISLEYRGYDSAGIAVAHHGKIHISRSLGKVRSLKKMIQTQEIFGHIGLGHTRWATHGKPSEENAHPHCDCHSKIVVVHNGIIENYLELKDILQNEGHRFQSQTDTEVIAHLIEKYYQGNLKEAVLKTLPKLSGSYSLGIMHVDHPNILIATRNNSPLIIGCGENENFISSDASALLAHTRQIININNLEIVSLTENHISIETCDGKKVNKNIVNMDWTLAQTQKSGYEHFMLKEIFEQPFVVGETFKSRVTEQSKGSLLIQMDLSEETIDEIQKIVIVSCGTSWHAGLIGRLYIESLSKIPVSVEYASEFRYKEHLIDKNTLVIAISQSGETADTLFAVQAAKEYSCRIMVICNVLNSSLAREASFVVYTHAGPEIGVASTKTFTCQLTILYLLAVHLAHKRNQLGSKEVSSLIDQLQHVPQNIEFCLKKENLEQVKKISKTYCQKTNFLYLGRGSGFVIALEGALKLKEISYIHAEGYHAGEMKHGPIALIDKNMPTVVLALQGRRYNKILSNIEEIKARDGEVIAIATEGDTKIAKLVDAVIYVPNVDFLLTPFVAVIPLQLLAYYMAVERGTDVDQPRHLAKSVTVE